MNSTKIQKTPYYLDTLETTSDWVKNKSLETQYHKVFRKHKTLQKLTSIIDSLPGNDKVNRKRYWATYHCNNILLQDGNKFSGSLCRKRWCTECCRVRTAELTNGYKTPLQDLGTLYFVTLTKPNVKGRQLHNEVRKMIKSFQRIKDNLRKNYQIKINGIRKIEVTYNKETDTYHPHFHLIQDNLHHAEKLQELWLNSNVTANIKGQDIRVINTDNDNSFIELFKYATKETTKGGDQYSGEVLHTIYNGLSGIRIYQTYGKIKKVKTPPKEKTQTNELNFVLPGLDIWLYDNTLIDYTNSDNTKLINTLTLKEQIQTKHHETRKKQK